MNLNDIALLRLRSQKLATSGINSAEEVIDWMGALQAQDFAMSKWATGMRMNETSLKIVESAIDEAKIIRTHVLRPTWHLVSSDDIYWMLELTGPRIRSALQSNDRKLELTESDFSKSNRLLEHLLRDHNHLTREEIDLHMNHAGIGTQANRLYHLLCRAEICKIICNGRSVGSTITYALLQERVHSATSLTREEGLAKLAKKYFRSHGPATLQDFIWWSGLTTQDAKRALHSIHRQLGLIKLEGQEFWYSEDSEAIAVPANLILALPAYDEFIISYKSRFAAVALESQSKAISSNGIFRPVIVFNGQVIGIWRRATKKGRMEIYCNLFVPASPQLKEQIDQAFGPYGQFWQTPVSVIIEPS